MKEIVELSVVREIVKMNLEFLEKDLKEDPTNETIKGKIEAFQKMMRIFTTEK